MPLLTENAYRETFGAKMVRIGADGTAPFPFWSYVDAIPTSDYQGYDCTDEQITWVWRDQRGHFEHILIDTKEDKDVFMVIVLDLKRKTVAGHRLMDFRREYGIR